MFFAIQIYDTTTGYVIDEMDSRFYVLEEDGPKLLAMQYRDHGIFLQLNDICREQFNMQIQVKGYETCNIEIHREELPEAMPLKKVFLIPSENPLRMDDMLTLKSRLPGLKKVSGVSLTNILAHTDSYEKRRRMMKVFEQGYRLSMEGSPYGVIHTKENTFDCIEVAKQMDTRAVQLQDPYPGVLPRNAPVSRIIIGMVEESGDYIFRVLRDDRYTRFLLRFETEDRTFFREYDFANPTELDYMEEETKESEA